MTSTTAPATFLEAQDVLAAQLPGYTRREHQEALAAAIEEVIASGDGRLLAQAGTGIGKSLAALIPLILSGKRGIVATSTKALQGQYATKDIPFLLGALGGFTAAVLKGRSNYACLAKINDLDTPSPQQSRLLEDLDEADRAGTDHDGDRENLPTVTNMEWGQLSMSAAECPGKDDCPFADKCYAERAKERAAEADVVITNTAYLAQDLILRQASEDQVRLLGDYGVLIIDEAHNLEAAITGALADRIGERALAKLARDINGYMMIEDEELAGNAVELASRDLWTALEGGFERHLVLTKGKVEPLRLTRSMIIRGFQDELLTLTRALATARTAVDATTPADDKGKLGRKRLLRRINDWSNRISYYAITDDDVIARWLEQETETVRGREETRLYMKMAPISIAPFMAEALWTRPLPVVLMSATLATGKSEDAFRYVRENLGLDEATEFDAGSPFDYPEQARLYVPAKSAPAPNGSTQQAWKSFAQEATQGLVEAAGGGALLLYTSRSAMEDAHRRLAPLFRKAGLTVLKQGEAPNTVLARWFKEDTDSVLFALRSFFEGFDASGRTLRLVVLDKLPFTPPTDVLHAARCDAVNRAHRHDMASFYHLTIPEMSLVLIQAFGRLIRHRDDKGVVAILDSRLMGKRYGATILRSLPPAPQTTDIHEAMAFLKES